MAVGRVEQIISLKGENNTRKAVEEAKSGLFGLGKATNTVAERSGDLERGFRGVGDILGKVTGVDLGPLTDGLGGIEGIIKGFGAALNPFTIALAGAGAAAYLVYQQTEKVRKAAIDTKIKELEIAMEDKEALAAKLGISKELVGVTNDLYTIEQVQADASARLNKLAEVKKQILEAQKEKEDEKVATLEKEAIRIQDLINNDRLRLAVAQLYARNEDARLAKVEQRNRERQEREDTINGLFNFRDRINAREALRQEKLLKLKVEQAKIEYRLRLDTEGKAKEEARITEITKERNALLAEQLADAKEVQDKAKERNEKAKQYAADERAALVSLAQTRAEFAQAAGADERQLYELKLAAIKLGEQAEIKAAKQSEGTAKGRAAKIEAIQLQTKLKEDKLREEAFNATAERDRESAEGAKRVAEAQIAAADQLRKARIAAAIDPAARADLQIADLRIEAERKVAQVRNDGLLDTEARAAKEKAIALDLATAITSAEKAKKDALAETAKIQREALQKTIDTSADIVASAAELVQSYQGKAGLGSALVETTKQIKAVSAGWNDNKNKASGVIGAVGNVAAAFVDGEREKAAILAVMEGAQAVASVAVGDIPGAIAHGAAAALYGSVAGGLISGGTAAPSAGGGGFAASGATAGTGEGGGGGPATTVINFNAPLGTSYEIGKSVVKAQKAAGASGWSPNMAMGV